jgi:hypothetical protein
MPVAATIGAAGGGVGRGSVLQAAAPVDADKGGVGGSSGL